MSTNDGLKNKTDNGTKPVLDDFVIFYKEEKEWDWTKGALPKIIVEILRPYSEGGMYYEYAYFTGFVLRVRHNWKYSKIAKRNRHEYDYEGIYITESGAVVRYYTWLGKCIYPWVDNLDNFA